MPDYQIRSGSVRCWLICPLAAAAIGFHPSLVGAQAAEGYFYGPRVDLPTMRVEGSASSRFRLSIRREARSEWERELISMAESLYPRAEIIADSVTAHLADPRNRIGTWEERFAEAAAAPGPRWWWLLDGETGLPFALTGETVAQYLAEYERLRDGPNPYAEYNPGVDHAAELVYVAAAQPRGVGYVVELSLEWSFYCGPLCALSFEHTRRVEFDASGRVTRVEGDRAPHYIVS